MQPGTETEHAMVTAMETAEIAVIVLSPEFLARKWPMKELLCFLTRREKDGADGASVPTVIPFFYRLTVDELYDEPRLDRLDKDGNPLYHESRFFERMKNGEAEANIGNIKVAMQKLHGIMGVRNDVNASNDSGYVMNRRREILLDELCDMVREAVPTGIAKGTAKASERRAERDLFHAHYYSARDTSKLVFNFCTADENLGANTPAGKLLEAVADRSLDGNRVIGVQGIGGVGKTSVLRGMSCLEQVKKRFEDGVYLFSLAMDATERELIETLSAAVQKSGGQQRSEEMLTESDWRKVVEIFRSWFAERNCLFMIDDVWESPQIQSSIIHELLALHESGLDSKVLITTRSRELASRAGTYIWLEPCIPLDSQARSILLRYSGIEPEGHEGSKVVEDILNRCSGLPLFLAVAGKAVKALSFRRGHEGCMAYHAYARCLEANMQSLLHTDVDSYQRLAARLKTSVEVLEERLEGFGFRVRLSIGEMHRRLSVLVKQARVPMSMLRRLWELGSESQTAVVAREFEQVGLADVEFGRMTSGDVELLRLHDSVYEFAVGETRKHGEERLGHETLVREYGRGLEEKGGCRVWWSRRLVPDGYIHGELGRHLVGAGLYEELVELLLRPEWAARMVGVCGVFNLEKDLNVGMRVLRDSREQPMDNASQSITTSDEGRFRADSETMEAVQLVTEAVRLSSGFVAMNPSEIWFQLHGRLIGHAERLGKIGTYVRRTEEGAPSPCVLSVNSFLVPPGGAATRIMSLGVPVWCMQLTNDGERVVCGSRDGRIAIVNVVRSEIESEWNADGEAVADLAIGRDGKGLVSVSEDGTAKVWDIESHRSVATFEGHTGKVKCVAVMGDGKRVVSGFDDGTAQLWDMDTGEVVSHPYGGHEEGWVQCVAVLPDGEHVVLGRWDNTFQMWDTTSGAQVGGQFVGHESLVECVAVTSDGRRIVSGSWDGTVRIWDGATSAQIGESSGGHAGVSSVAISTDGNRIVSGFNGGAIRLWEAHSLTEICDPLEGHTSHVTGVSFLSGSDSIVSCSEDGTVRLWDVRRQNVESVADRHEADATSVSFTPNGKHVVSGSDDRMLRIWDATSGRHLGEPLTGHSGPVSGVAVAPDGRRVVSVSKDITVRVWDLGSRKCVHTLNGHTDWIRCVALTPKGDCAVTGSMDKTVRVWDLAAADGTHFVLEELSAAVERVFFSDDGLRVVSVVGSNEISVWDLQSQQRVKRVSKDDAWRMSRRQVMDAVGETICPDDAGLSTPLRGREIWCGERQNAPLLATLDAYVEAWEVSPEKRRICLGLEGGQVAFMKLKI